MKNLLLLLLISFSAVMCRKDIQPQEPTSKTNVSIQAESAANLPDLIIEKFSMEYDGWINGYGLWYTGGNFHLITYFGITYLQYDCPIANIAPQVSDRSTNFVLKMSEWGTPVGTHGYYSFNGFLEAVLFENGLPIDTLPKNIFYTSTTDHKINFDWSLAHDYLYDTMYVEAQGADLYNPRMKVKQENGIATDGQFLIAVTINPQHKFPEASFDNNTEVLPFKVLNNVSTLDPSAIDVNKTHPATNLTKTFSRGYNYLNWDCPYHEPFHITHWFTIYKDGVLLADNVQNSDYIDKDNKKAVYTVYINVPGLGRSPGISK